MGRGPPSGQAPCSGRESRDRLVVRAMPWDERRPGGRVAVPRTKALYRLSMSTSAAVDRSSPDLEPDVSVTFASDTSRATVASPAATKAAFAILIEHWPCAIDVDALCDSALGRAASGRPTYQIRRAMLEDLFGAVMQGLIEPHTQPPRCTNRPLEMPRGHPVAAFARRGHRRECAPQQAATRGAGARGREAAKGRRRPARRPRAALCLDLRQWPRIQSTSRNKPSPKRGSTC